jgi:CubicO group peptidase (beta-lactamase class C family)
MRSFVLLTSVLLSACAGPRLRIENRVAPAGMEQRLTALHVPAMSVAVIHHGEIAWTHVWGSEITANGTKVDPRTQFQAASVGKWVTALAVLRLVDARQVRLDADVKRALRSWRLNADGVTLRALLSHTGGLNVSSVPGYAFGQPLPTLQQILDGLPPATNPPIRVEHPLGAFEYSGGGSTVVQQLLEDVSAKPFARLMKETLFEPLGLRRTTFELPNEAFLSGAARCVDELGAPQPAMVNPEAAAAGLWSTPGELATMLIEVQRALAGHSTLLSRDSARELITPVTTVMRAEDNDGVEVSMAVGSFLERRNGRLYFGHDGRNDGFLTIARATEDGEGVVVMSDGAAAAPLMLELISAIAAEYGWPGW